MLVGENGSGKSTLIEAIAIKAGFNPDRCGQVSRRCTRLARGTKRELAGGFLAARQPGGKPDCASGGERAINGKCDGCEEVRVDYPSRI